MILRNEMFASPFPPDLTSAERVDGSLANMGFKGKEMVSSGTDGATGAGDACLGDETGAGLAGTGADVLGETGGGAGVAFLVDGGGAATGLVGASGSVRLNLLKKLLS